MSTKDPRELAGRPVRTMEDAFGHADHRRVAARNPSSLGRRGLPTDTVAAGPTVTARINHGRWIGDCPVPTCAGAEYVSHEQPTFFCCECRNEAVGRALLPVVFPLERKAIEAELEKRGEVATQNWRPGETVEELQAELTERAEG